ncbi:hypothetical protein ACHAQA_002049 [Verticillium albo-atrum]
MAHLAEGSGTRVVSTRNHYNKPHVMHPYGCQLSPFSTQSSEFPIYNMSGSSKDSSRDSSNEYSNSDEPPKFRYSDGSTVLATSPPDLLSDEGHPDRSDRPEREFDLVGIHADITPMPSWSVMADVADKLARSCPHVTVLTGLHLKAITWEGIEWHQWTRRTQRSLRPVVLVGVTPGKVGFQEAQSIANKMRERMDEQMKPDANWGVIVAQYEMTPHYVPPGGFNPNYKPAHHPAKIVDMVYPDFSDIQNAAGQLMGRSIGVAGSEKTGSSGFTLRARFPNGESKYFLTTAHHVVAEDSSPIKQNSEGAAMAVESPSSQDHEGWLDRFAESLARAENNAHYRLLLDKEAANALVLGQNILKNKRQAIENTRTMQKRAGSYDRSIGTVFQSSGDMIVRGGWLQDWALIELAPRLVKEELVLHNTLSTLMQEEFDNEEYWPSTGEATQLQACYLLGRTSVYNAGSFNRFPTYVWHKPTSGDLVMTKTMLVVSSTDPATRSGTFSQTSDSGGAVLDKAFKPVGILWGGARAPQGSLEKRADSMVRRAAKSGVPDGLHFVFPLKTVLEDIQSTLRADCGSEVQVELVGAEVSPMSVEFESREDDEREHSRRLEEKP